MSLSDTVAAATLAADLPDLPERKPSKARAALLKRLADVVCLPSTRVNAFERAMTADLLVEMLREAELEERARVSRRLAHLTEIPHSLVRLLLRDDIEVARPLLEDCASLSETDLVRCAREASLEHRRLTAVRRGVGELLAEALIDAAEPPVIEALLKNDTARLSQPAIESVVALSREHGRYVGLLLRRPELRPSHAYIMFWWAGAEDRRTVLQRFAVSREVLQDAASDVFSVMADEGWQDPLARKALQFIERRQRNRAAIERSEYASLDSAIERHQTGLTRRSVEEISYMSGLKPSTGAKIFMDGGGEPLAVLCKATGLPKSALRQLWRGLRRPELDAEGRTLPGLERVLWAYDAIAVDRAQTVLRYWNWALSSALDEHSAPQRAAMLVFSNDLSR
jgi:uncharacterized protein (DUF2336 family)